MHLHQEDQTKQNLHKAHTRSFLMNLEKASEVYDAIYASSYPELAEDLVKAAVRYSQQRAEWFLKDAEGRQEMEDSRTSAHNAFIDTCNILSRNMAKIAEDVSWRDQIGNDRKAIGDFACYLHCLLGLKAR